MDVTELDLCVVLPINALETWVRADPASRAKWLALGEPIRVVDVGGAPAYVFRRAAPRPVKALVTIEPRKCVAVVVQGTDADISAAIESPETRDVLAERVKLSSALLVIGGDLAHADVGGGTPVAGPHRIVDLAPGDYQVEARRAGDAQVIVFER